MGGGRRVFLSKDDLDPETGEKSTKGRLDGRNLVNVKLCFLIKQKLP